MNKKLLLLAIGSIALAASAGADARVNVNVDLNPFGFGVYAAPPVVYQAPHYAPAPPVVYVGGGSWGGDRDRGRGHARPPARNDHARGGEHR